MYIVQGGRARTSLIDQGSTVWQLRRPVGSFRRFLDRHLYADSIRDAVESEFPDDYAALGSRPSKRACLDLYFGHHSDGLDETWDRIGQSFNLLFGLSNRLHWGWDEVEGSLLSLPREALLESTGDLLDCEVRSWWGARSILDDLEHYPLFLVLCGLPLGALEHLCRKTGARPALNTEDPEITLALRVFFAAVTGGPYGARSAADYPGACLHLALLPPAGRASQRPAGGPPSLPNPHGVTHS